MKSGFKDNVFAQLLIDDGLRGVSNEKFDKIATEHFDKRDSLKDKNITQGFNLLNKQDGASQQKQDEWANMSQQDRNVERQNKPDTDGDRVPDEYDYNPDTTTEQDNQ